MSWQLCERLAPLQAFHPIEPKVRRFAADKQRMSRLANLSTEDQAKVDAKLAELGRKTGELWACEITQKPQNPDSLCLLEIAINGHISQPVVLEVSSDNPGDRICSEMDLFYNARLVSA